MVERKMPSVGVVIAGGGHGARMHGKVPKQFLPLERIPIIERTIALFQSLRFVNEIVVVIPKEYIGRTARIVRKGRYRKVSTIIAGGNKRQDSVRIGLHAFKRKPEFVLVHDAVRPLVSPVVVQAVLRETKKHRAAVVGVHVNDTIKLAREHGFYAETLDRSVLWAVQTPQGFVFDLLANAHTTAQIDGFGGTDDASLVERLGIPIKIVEGDNRNIKITTREDLELAKLLLRQGFSRK
jgi:2-C-methyl-D-erythritol 4-phosphate cytidylyltransferase